MRLKKAFYFWAAASVLCMLLIFMASAQPAEASGELSGGLTHFVFGNLWSLFAAEGQELSEGLFITFETFLRKSAHFVVFFVLGFCASNTVRHLTDNRRRVFWISLLWSSAYGALDEFHQTFVPGRAGMWQDWVIDTVGALFGIWFMFLFVWRQKK